MTQSLREEIRKSIEPNAKTFHDEKIIVDKILKIFEKRIDSITPKKINRLDNIDAGYMEAIRRVKEMLK